MRKQGYYWVKVAGHGWVVALWRCDEVTDPSWGIAGWDDCFLDDEDLETIGPRIEPPKEEN